MSVPQRTEASAIAYIEEQWFKLVDVRLIREVDGKWQFERQVLASHLLIAVAGGQGQLLVDGTSHSLTSDEIWICRPGQCVEATVYAFEQGVYWFAFDTGAAGCLPDEGAMEGAAVFPVLGSTGVAVPAMMTLCRTLAEQWFGIDRLQRLRSQAAFHELLYGVLQAQTAAPEIGLTALIEKAKCYIEEHCREPISFEKLAQETGISSRHFRRLFRSLYGKSTVDYLTELRMNHARQLMRQPDIPLWEVAQSVGYHDESHFRRTFKNYVGIAPALYLKNQHLKVAAYSWPNIGMVLPLQMIPFAAPIDHYWTDYYRSKYGFDVRIRLRHDYDFNRKALYVARPDRIIATDEFVPEREQELLSHIAPVLFVPWRSADWREHLQLTAAFLDRQQEAEAWLAHYDRNQGLIQDKVRQLVQREKWLVLMIDRKRIYRWGRAYEGTARFHQLPLAPARHLDSLEPGYEPIEVKQAADTEADRILVLLSEDGASHATWQTVHNAANWQNLKPVQANRVHLIRIGPWYEYSAFNHDLIQQQALRLLGVRRT